MESTALRPLLKETYSNWSDHHATRLAASTAFYTLLSLAPLLMLLVSVVSLVLGTQHARADLANKAQQMVGSSGAATVQLLLANGQKSSSGILAGVISFVVLLFGASGVFTELREALNIIWEAKPKAGSGVVAMVVNRLFAFLMVFALGLLLLITVIVSTALAFMGRYIGQVIPIPTFVLEIIYFFISLGIVTLVFGLIFKYIPAASTPWRNIWFGAAATAFLFTVGKLLLGLYLGKASVGSGYGVAGSVVAVVVWVYYSAQIFFFGAELTRAYERARERTEIGAAGEEAVSREPGIDGPNTLPDTTGAKWRPVANHSKTSRPEL